MKRTCDILGIRPKTYYHKLEWLYRKCLEFLERHESQAFADKDFFELWVSTDKMIYNLNNIRRRGKGGVYDEAREDTKFQTRLLVSTDALSRYVFRADIAYDFDISLEDVEDDTVNFREDHVYGFCRKNERLRLPFCPQPPTENDTQEYSDYLSALSEFNTRKKYMDGIHTVDTYTGAAHFFLLKDRLTAITGTLYLMKIPH